jgi:hypothetical protein
VPRQYPVPWDLVFGLTPYLRTRTRRDVDDFTAQVAARLEPPPVVEGVENISASFRFVLASNHYQRKGLWILHTASVLTQAVRRALGLGDPPVRWVVTANWPPLRIGPWRIPSPGDILLPRVADVLHCYPVSFAKHNPAFTARSLRRLLREAAQTDRPLGLFPEGVAGSAGTLSPPLPGVDRLLAHLARLGFHVQPAGVWEEDALRVRFGPSIPASDLLAAPDAAALVMERIRALIPPRV